jgi:methylmalonyl-CoA mutase
MMGSNDRLSFEEFSKIAFTGWQLKVSGELKNEGNLDSLLLETYEELPVKPLYHMGDVEHYDQLTPAAVLARAAALSRDASGNRKPLELRQEIFAADPAAANEYARLALGQGVGSLSFYTRFNDQRVRGVAVQFQSDMATLLAGIDVEKVALFFDWGLHAPAVVALLLNEMERRGIAPQNLKGGLLFDPISEMLPAGSYCGMAENLFKRLQKLHHVVTTQMGEGFAPLTIKGHPYHNAGAHAGQELAFTMATAIEYAEFFKRQGVDLASFLGLLQFSFSIGSNFFMEIAKLRAARILWQTICETYLGADGREMPVLNLHARTGRVNKSSIEPTMNIVRETTEALAAIMGGAGSLSIVPYDEVYSDGSGVSHEMSGVIGQILLKESAIALPIDPCAGSYYVETLTQNLAEKAWQLLQKVEAAGGMIAAIEKGLIQREVSKVRTKRVASVAVAQDRLIGVNYHVAAVREPQEIPGRKTETPLSVDTSEHRQLLIDPYSIDQIQYALMNGFSVGDMAGPAYRSDQVLKFEPLTPYRMAALHERIQKMMSMALQNGKQIKAQLLVLDDLAVTMARMHFVRNFLQSGGWQVTDLRVASSPTGEESAVPQKVVEADAVVLVGADERYPFWAKELFSELTRSHPHIIKIVAGYPISCLDTLKSYGTDEFIHQKSGAPEFFMKYASRLGITA